MIGPADLADVARWFKRQRYPVLVAVLWATLVALVAWVPALSGVHTCQFRRITGTPCATCGSTRAFHALADADPLGALALNPLMTIVMLGLPMLVLVWMIKPASVRALADAVFRHSVVSSIVFLVLLAANWAYVLQAGV